MPSLGASVCGLLAAALFACAGGSTSDAGRAGFPQAWYAPAEPLHVVGPIHSVGTRDLAVFLVTTPAGHILIGGGMPGSEAVIEASILALGFDPEDIRILLSTHAHADTDVEEGGRTFRVVFAGSLSVNPGTRFVHEPSYPGILEDYRRSIEQLESLQPDIWLAPHASQCGLEGKRARAASEGALAFVDPQGYRTRVAEWKAAFEKAVAEE